MKKRDINIVGLMLMILSVSMVSCSTTTKIYPYHASVEEIYNLSSGMNMQEVEKTLGSMLFYITDSGKERAQSSLATSNDLNMMKAYPQFFNNKKKGSGKSSGISAKKRKKILGLF